jgi:hypothetical protein
VKKVVFIQVKYACLQNVLLEIENIFLQSVIRIWAYVKMFVVLARGLDVLGIRNVFMGGNTRLFYGKKCCSWNRCWRLGGDKLRSYWFKVYKVMAVQFISRTEIFLTYEENDGKS